MSDVGIDAERLYLDFDSFFATAEQHFNPDLRNRPVGVVPLDSAHTGCIAISREAKSLGLKFGATIKDARLAVPDIVFVVARPDAYVRLHHKILGVIEACLPVANVRSIDEVVCHLMPSEATDTERLATGIKTALAKSFSPVLTCSIGIAKTELLAKIGAEMNKPDGLVVLHTSDLPHKINHLLLTDLPGVSRGIEARLHAAGVCDISTLWRLAPKHMRAIWGTVEGERFWNGLHGHHIQRSETIKRMFGHSRMLPLDWRSSEKVRICARQLTMSAGRRVRRADFRATKISLGFRGGARRSSKANRKNSLRWGWEGQFRPSRDDNTFLNALSKGLARAEKEVNFKPKSVSVMLHGLVAKNEIQHDLFNPTCGHSDDVRLNNAQEKWETLSVTMDQLRAVHGPTAVSLGPRDDIPGGYLGAKIAFGRIPELEDFSETPTEDGATHFCSF